MSLTHPARLPPPAGSAPRLCPRDGWPMLLLPDPAYLRHKQARKWVCLAETLNHCIGSQRITDVIYLPATRTLYYVFESGHQLPWLCGCCGQPLACDDLARARYDLIGCRLESFVIQDRQLEDGTAVSDRAFSELVLEFAPRSANHATTTATVALDVLVHLRHPSNCSRLALGPRARS